MAYLALLLLIIHFVFSCLAIEVLTKGVYDDEMLFVHISYRECFDEVFGASEGVEEECSILCPVLS